jgi:FMN phosphatase YigB (HAD superfamily)
MITEGEDMSTTKQKSIAQRRKEINLTVDHGIRAVCFDLNGVLIDYTKEHPPIDRIIKTVERANLIFDGRTAVVTNCPRVQTEKALKDSGLFDLFQYIVTIDDFWGSPKPSPRGYMLAQEKFGIKGHKSILAIDDTGRGIMSAIGARFRTWWLEEFDHLTPDNLVKVLNSYRITL